MSELSLQIAEFNEQMRRHIPKIVRDTMRQATEDLKRTGIEDGVLQDGEVAPHFSLRNGFGEERALTSFLDKGPVVLNFCRGGWCPYCSMEFEALRKSLPDIRELGAQLVTVMPEYLQRSPFFGGEREKSFEVLHDKGNLVAESYGLSFVLNEKMRPLYSQFGIDLPTRNGDNTFRLPIPATYVIESNGVVAFHFADADYTHRLEPDDLLFMLEEIQKIEA